MKKLKPREVKRIARCPTGRERQGLYCIQPLAPTPYSFWCLEGAWSIHRGSSRRGASPLVNSSLKEVGLCPTQTPSHVAYCVCKVGQAGHFSISSLRPRSSLARSSCPQLLYSIVLSLNALALNAWVQVQDVLLTADGPFGKLLKLLFFSGFKWGWCEFSTQSVVI